MTTKIATTNIQDSALTTLLGPKVTTIVYPGTETATDTAGGETINLTGNGFQSGCNVLVGSTSASVVTFISSTQISFTAPAMTANTYVLYVINPDGGTAISIPGISYSGTPNWTTSAGSLGTAYEAGSISTTLVATGDAPITYTLATGTLPSGSSLASNGTLSGTAPATASATTYNFTITAKDAQNQTTNRAFSLTINPDVVTWSSPTNSQTYNVNTNTAIANVTMSATSAAGGSITYTADTLPTGLSITGANIAGTPTVAASTTTVLTATATSTRSATRTINWVVSVAADTYWKNTTLLLNGETTVTPFINDASTNSLALTIQGDTKPVLFNPYQGVYYSNYFNGSTDYLTAPASAGWAFGSGDFTVECWVYFTSTPQTVTQFAIIANQVSADNATWTLQTYNGNFRWVHWSGGYYITGSSTLVPNVWYHVAVARTGGVNRLFVNGVLDGSVTGVQAYTTNAILYIGNGNGAGYFPGYISNVRILKGTALYTSAFTPPTTPLTAVANTQILTCQSNRFIDNSTNAAVLTATGTPQISPNIPFTANSSYSTYGSAYFDGTGDYLSRASSAPTQMGSSNFTTELWVYQTSIATNQCFYVQQDASISNNTSLSYGIYCSTAGTITIVLAASSSRYDFSSTAGIISKINQWYHIALTRNGNVFTLYVNGVSVGTTTAAITLNTNALDYIGLYANAGASDYQYTNGYISDFRIVKGTAVYTTAFTPPTSPLTAITNTQLLTLQYNGGANNYGIIDNSPFNNIITRNGNATQGSFSPYSQTGWSTYFNGTSNWLAIPTSTNAQLSTGNFTIEVWIYALASSGVIVEQSVIDEGSGNNVGWILSLTSSGVQFSNASGTTYIAAGLPSGVASLVNRWAHVALVRTSTTNISIYVDGQLYTSTSTNVDMNMAYNYRSDTPTLLGVHELQLAGSYYNGYMSNFRMVKGTALYTTTFTPSTTPLTPISGTSILVCQSNRHIDNSPSNAAVGPSFGGYTGGSPTINAFSPFGSISEAIPQGYSVYFDGTNDNVTLASTTVLNIESVDFTIEAWINMKTMPTATSTTGWGGDYNSWFVIYERSGGGTAGWQFRVGATLLTLGGDGDSSICWGTHGMSAGTWYHVAVSRQSGTYKLFVNGTSLSLTTQAVSMGTSGPYYIGSEDTSGANFNGYISNLRVIKGTALYTSAFTPSTTPLTTTSQGATASQVSLLTCQSNVIIDNSLNALTISTGGKVKPKPYNPFGYTAQSATSYTPNLHGGSAYFDGTGDYLTVPTTTQLNFSSGDFTVEAWVYPNSISNDWFIISATGSGGFFFGLAATYGYGWGRNATAWDYRVAGYEKINIWQHIAVTRSGTSMKLFVNGTQIGTTQTVSTAYDLSTTSTTIGSQGTTYYLNGYISDLRVIKGTAVYISNFVPPTQTLTNYSTTYPSSLLLNFNNGGIIDQHSSNVLENVNGPQLSTAVKKYNNGSLSFSSASSQYLFMLNRSSAFIFASGDFTIELWVNISDTTARKYILGPGTDTASHYKGFGLEIWNQQLCMWASSNGTSWDLLECDTSANRGSTLLSSGTWYHIAVTRNGNTYRSFINGTVEKTFTVSGSIYSDITIPYNIGRTAYTGGNFYYNGYMDDLRITKGYARYTSNFTAPTSALITK